jgi:type II secretory pathway component PulF
MRNAHDPTWRGPVYWNARVWRRDIVLVSEHLRSLIACNAPLAPGLAAGAREDLRARTSWTPQRASLLVRVAGAIVLLLAIGLNIALAEEGLDSPGGGLQAMAMILISLWLAKVLLTDRQGRAGVFLALEHRISCGWGLSDAMGTLPRFFPRHLVDLVEAGEATGNMDPAFDQFNDAMLRSLGTQRQLRAILWYLAIVLVAQVSIASFLLVKVIPVFVEIRQEAAADSGVVFDPNRLSGDIAPLIGSLLPGLDALVALGGQLYSVAPIIAMAIVLGAALLVIRRFRGRRNWSARRSSAMLTVLPWFRGLVVRHNLGQIALMLHGLLRAGVPLDRALAMALGSDIHPAYRQWLGKLRDRVCQGDSLKDALRRTASRRLIPDSFVGLIEAGERSGQLPETLEHIADLYRRDTEKRLAILQAIVLPAGVLMLGYLVMATQVTVFRVLIDLSEFVNA